MDDKHCGICGATTEPLRPEIGGVLGGFMECVDDAACLIRAAQNDEPEAALATPVDPEEKPCDGLSGLCVLRAGHPADHSVIPAGNGPRFA